MIAQDQPTCFPKDVIAGVSSREDGSMLDRTLDDRHHNSIIVNRLQYCKKIGIDYQKCVYQIINYGPENTFDRIVQLDSSQSIDVHADVLYTEQPKVGLFLPIADCIGTIIYDPTRKAIALAHLGRHASVADTIKKTIDFFTMKGSRPQDLIIWMAPSVGRKHYRMEYFDHHDDKKWRDFCQAKDGGFYLDLQGYNRARAVTCGVMPVNIHASRIDTATDPNYFSHSQGDKSARFAVVAMIS